MMVHRHSGSTLFLDLGLLWRKEFRNPTQWTKYSHLYLIFPKFLNKILFFLPVELVLLWHGKAFSPKNVLPTSWSCGMLRKGDFITLTMLSLCLWHWYNEECLLCTPSTTSFIWCCRYLWKWGVIPAKCYWCRFGLFTENFLVCLLGFKASTPILSDVLPKQLLALREDASFLF